MHWPISLGEVQPSGARLVTNLRNGGLNCQLEVAPKTSGTCIPSGCSAGLTLPSPGGVNAETGGAASAVAVYPAIHARTNRKIGTIIEWLYFFKVRLLMVFFDYLTGFPISSSEDPGDN
ncbi:hypothetical protein OR1_02350 [Geobacter sp. OR-1]|nr:hypothetical protein OR1_02350 [Geobacter sp. OR-1]